LDWMWVGIHMVIVDWVSQLYWVGLDLANGPISNSDAL